MDPAMRHWVLSAKTYPVTQKNDRFKLVLNLDYNEQHIMNGQTKFESER